MITVSLPTTSDARAYAQPEPEPRPAPRRPAPQPPREPAPAPEPGPRPRPAPRPPRRGNGDAGRIETIERAAAKAHREIEKAMTPVANIGWQLDLAVHAHRRGVLSPKVGPYLQDRINNVSYKGVQGAAEEGAFQAIKAIEGTMSGARGPVVAAARAAIDSVADAKCATRGQVDMLQQSLDALLKQKPHPDPCGDAPAERAPSRPRRREEITE